MNCSYVSFIKKFSNVKISSKDEAFDFIAVEDCGRANICAMKSDSADSFYNVGTGKICGQMTQTTGQNVRTKGKD